jgi:hypothetical protein
MGLGLPADLPRQSFINQPMVFYNMGTKFEGLSVSWGWVAHLGMWYGRLHGINEVRIRDRNIQIQRLIVKVVPKFTMQMYNALKRFQLYLLH